MRYPACFDICLPCSIGSKNIEDPFSPRRIRLEDRVDWPKVVGPDEELEVVVLQLEAGGFAVVEGHKCGDICVGRICPSKDLAIVAWAG